MQTLSTNNVKEVFNLSDEQGRIDKAIRILKMSDNNSVASVNLLTDIARKDWRCNDSLAVANTVFDALKGLRNQAYFKKFCKDFCVFCGYHGIYTDKNGNDKIAYLPYDKETAIFDFTKSGITKNKNEYTKKRNFALANSEKLIAKNIKFWYIAPCNLPENDKGKIAKAKYDKIISLFKDLRDSHNDWQDSENSTEIAKALNAMATIMPSLKADFLEKIMAELTTVSN